MEKDIDKCREPYAKKSLYHPVSKKPTEWLEELITYLRKEIAILSTIVRQKESLLEEIEAELAFRAKRAEREAEEAAED